MTVKTIRLWLSVLLVTGIASAQTYSIDTKTDPTAAPSQTITFTSATAQDVTLVGVGTLTGGVTTLSNVTTWTYTAPSSVVNLASEGGCPVLPNGNIFSTKISSLPVISSNATWNATYDSKVSNGLGLDGTWPSPSVIDNSVAGTLFDFYYGGSMQVPFPPFPALHREGGVFIGGDNTDHHEDIVRHTDCGFWEVYGDSTPTSVLFSCQDSTRGTVCNASSGRSYSGLAFDTTAPAGGVDAAAMPVDPLIFKLGEIEAGQINHALRFVVNGNYISSGPTNNNVAVWPAQAYRFGGAGSAYPYYGARARLAASVDITSGGTITDPKELAILQAAKDYGIILADAGSDSDAVFNGEVELSLDPAVLSMNASAGSAVSRAMSFLSSTTICANGKTSPCGIWDKFEWVDQSSLQITSGPYAGSYAINPTNASGIMPAGYAALETVPHSGGSTTITPIALQGVSVGMPNEHHLLIMAGMSGYQLQWWVNPSSVSQVVTWSLVSGVGSVTTGGVYTPPSQVSCTVSTSQCTQTQYGLLKGVPTADPNNPIYVDVIVSPNPNANIDGVIRFSYHAQPSYFTTSNNSGQTVYWTAAPLEANVSSSAPTGDYPAWQYSPSDSPLIAYEARAYGYGPDMEFRNIVLPNGNYKLHYLNATATCCVGANHVPTSFNRTSAQIAVNSPPGVNYWHKEHYAAQGQIALHNRDPWSTDGFQEQKPVDSYIPARVTNNTLTTGLFGVFPDTARSGKPSPCNQCAQKAEFTSLEIIPDTSPAHWTIDTDTQVTSISPGSTLQCYVTDWYTGVNDPTWSIVSGPASISTGGLVTATAGTYFGNTQIIVKAVSQSQPQYSAMLTLYVSGTQQAMANVRPNNHWYYQRPITISHTITSANQTNFPLLVSVTDSTLAARTNGGHLFSSSGYDLKFTSDSAGATAIPFEIESYSNTSGQLVAWVQVPTVSASVDTTIYLWYGNPSIIATQATPSSVWDSNYKVVAHMFSSNGNLSIKDSTSNGNNPAGSALTSLASGKIASSVFLNANGGNEYLWFPFQTYFSASSGTIEFWVNAQPIGSNTTQNTVQAFNATPLFNSFIELFSSDGTNMMFGSLSDDSGGHQTDQRIKIPLATFASEYTEKTWTHCVLTWDTTSAKEVVYLNGASIGSYNTFNGLGTVQSGALLRFGDRSNSGYFNGYLDEIRVSTVARSAAYVQAAYNTENNPGGFETLGSETIH